ncbi:MAG TPA: competence/damage-inducible protein A [Candidatus Binataceae bacterium]|nr:competence/damage-inducible protein A [Candidatus Binataceae bacterium]
MIQKAVILSTGDEITAGRIVDTNSNYIADKLAEVGLEVAAVLTVGDVPERLEWAWKTAMAMADVVISTGGIGPTADDLTNETVARITGKKLVRDQESVDHMTRIFASINRVMPENNLKQADLPDTSVIVRNPLGTAPGFRMAVPQAGGHICHLVVLPGVPREMKPMMEDTVLPWLRSNRGTDTIFAVRVFQTFGISESGLDEAVAGLIKPEEARVAFRAAFPQISLRVTVEGRPGEADRKLDELSERVRGRIANFIYAEGDASMEEVIARLFTERGLKLAVAESCTGGLIGHRITNVAGSSKYFVGDFVTYSNSLKTGLLGVREETLKAHGAVSEQCVLEMAAGARERAGADVAIATSGVAGPEGGTAAHPVGTVCLGLVGSSGVKAARRYQLRGNRDWIKTLTGQVALDWLRRYALGLPIGDATLFRR